MTRPSVELFPHQEEAIENMHNGCVLYGDVGVGKTFTALGYAIQKEPGKKIYVITTARKRDSGDWAKEAQQMGVLFDDIVIDSWNNIGKYTDVSDALFIFDEQRLVGAGAWVQSFYTIARFNRWVLLTATPGDTWLDFIPVFIANGFYKNITEFRREHVIYSRYTKYPQVDRFVNVKRLVRFRERVLVKMPLMRDTTRHLKIVDVEYDKERFDYAIKKRWNIFEDAPMMNVAEMFRVGRQIVGQDERKLDAIRELMKEHPRLIVFYNYDYELEMLRKLAWERFYAEWNGHKHEPVPITDEWIYAVQYVAGAEAWNCITTDAMIFYSLTYSYKNFHQAQGRIDRMNTPFKDLYYYVLMTKAMTDKVVWKSILEKRDFQPARTKFEVKSKAA